MSTGAVTKKQALGGRIVAFLFVQVRRSRSIFRRQSVNWCGDKKASSRRPIFCVPFGTGLEVEEHFKTPKCRLEPAQESKLEVANFFAILLVQVSRSKSILRRQSVDWCLDKKASSRRPISCVPFGTGLKVEEQHKTPKCRLEPGQDSKLAEADFLCSFWYRFGGRGAI